MTTEGIIRRADDALLALVDDRAPEYSDGVAGAVENLMACLAPAAPQEDLYRTFLDANRHRSARYWEGLDAVHQWLNGLLREMRAPAAALTIPPVGPARAAQRASTVQIPDTARAEDATLRPQKGRRRPPRRRRTTSLDLSRPREIAGT